jgi:small-conductance mechanosensitive channel
MTQWRALLGQEYLGNPVSSWLLAAALFFGSLIVVWIVLQIVDRYWHRVAEESETHLDDLAVATLAKTKLYFILLVAAWGAIQVLWVPPWIYPIVRNLAVVALVLQAGLWAGTLLHEWIGVVKRRKAGEEETVTWLSGAEWAGKLVIWSLALLVGLENLGVDVTGLATGMGIGGIAVALAAQSILGDLFASMSIYLDRPFVIGDFLAVDGHFGTVERIGMKSTRLQSLSGEQLVFGNSDLLGSRIRNFGRMKERRASFNIGVTYDTPAAKLERIPQMIREAIESHPNTRFDRSHFKGFGDSALEVETVYYMLVPTYADYMDTQQAVNLTLMERFEDEGIDFAFPTRTVHVVAENGGAASDLRS